MYSTFLEKFVKNYFVLNPIKFEGEKKEFYKLTKAAFRPKHHRGLSAKTSMGIWNYRHHTKPGLGYMEIVEKRDSKTLLSTFYFFEK